MLIKRKYERLVNVGNYENIKVGVMIEKEIKGTDADSIKKAGKVIGDIAKAIVENEVVQIKKDETNKKQETHEEVHNEQ